MTSFRPTDVTVNLGYDCAALSPSAHALESSVEFKRSAELDFARHFDFWRQDRSFTTPYAGRVVPSTALQPNSFGDVDPTRITDLLEEHLAAHALQATSIRPIAAPSAACVYWPPTKEWIIVGGFHLELDGQLLIADRATDEFEMAYRSGRPTVPATFDSDMQEMRAMRATAFVQWAV